MNNWFIYGLIVLTLGACVVDLRHGDWARAGMFFGWVVADIFLLWVR